MPDSESASIRRALLRWYDRVKRDLPWRRTKDPYAIWISEIMLQQTRVAAALPYYQRFLERFPTVLSLAEAPQDEVLKAWSGLGYYSRARNLQRAAIVMSANGGFPSDYDGIRALPGVGDYTAAAVASIAFGSPRAAVDGNVLRVLSRVTAEAGDIQSALTRRKLASIAYEWIDRKRPGDFNQALMELGATVCTPKAPECELCPLAARCEAARLGRAGEYPIKLKKTERREVREKLYSIERGGRILLWRRDSASRRLAGFWELPSPPQLAQVSHEEVAGEFRHTIVNTTYRFEVIRARARKVPTGLEWVARSALGELPLSTTARKALRMLQANASQPG